MSVDINDRVMDINTKSRRKIGLKISSKVILICHSIFAPRKKAFISPRKHVVGSHKKHLCDMLLMNTHNICFCGEIQKISMFQVVKKCLIWNYVTYGWISMTRLNSRREFLSCDIFSQKKKLNIPFRLPSFKII